MPASDGCQLATRQVEAGGRLRHRRYRPPNAHEATRRPRDGDGEARPWEGAGTKSGAPPTRSRPSERRSPFRFSRPRGSSKASRLRAFGARRWARASTRHPRRSAEPLARPRGRQGRPSRGRLPHRLRPRSDATPSSPAQPSRSFRLRLLRMNDRQSPSSTTTVNTDQLWARR